MAFFLMDLIIFHFNSLEVYHKCDTFAPQNDAIMETGVRKQTSFRLSETLLEQLKVEANKVNRSLNNFVENALMELVSKKPNQTTIDAIQEARSDKELETLDLTNFKEYVAGL